MLLNPRLQLYANSIPELSGH